MPATQPLVPELSCAEGMDTYQITPDCSVKFSEHIHGTNGSLGMLVNDTKCVIYFKTFGCYYAERKEHTFEDRRKFEHGLREAAVRFLKRLYGTDNVHVRRINYPNNIRGTIARS